MKPGKIRQSANPYAIDAVLRIVHTLVLSGERRVPHACSQRGTQRKGVLFAGVSGAGKTTIAGLAPPDAMLLTDEISYMRRQDGGYYYAFGTPFAGELAKVGENVSAPLEGVVPAGEGSGKPDRADRRMRKPAGSCLANILFFAQDEELGPIGLSSAACEFVRRVPVYRLTFMPEARCVGDDRMNGKCYVARSSEIAARLLGEEMMIMSGQRFDLIHLERGGDRHLGGGRRIHSAGRDRGAQDLPGV